MQIKNIIVSMYVGYGAWFSILGNEQWDDGNTISGDDWKQIGSVWDRDLSVLFLYVLGTEPVPFGTRAIQIWTG